MIELILYGRGGQGGVTLAKLIATAWFLRVKWAQAFGVYAAERSGVHYVVGSHAFRIRNDWARAPLALEQQQRVPQTEPPRRLIDTLRRSALAADVPNPLLNDDDWRERWYGN